MSWTHTRSRIAHELRADPNADVTELRRQLKAERLADHIERTVATAPPLTEEQRDLLASLLAPRARVRATTTQTAQTARQVLATTGGDLHGAA